MSRNNCTTKKQRFKYLMAKERYQIEVLLKEKRSPNEIAKILGRHKRTIEREIARGTVRMLTSELEYKNVYCADTAQRKYEENAKNKGAELKIGNDYELARHIEDRIVINKYSPDAVIGEIRAKELKFKTQICTKTLYHYIDKGVFLNLTNKDLPVKKNRKKGNYKKVRISYKNLKGTSIEERPQHIETREEYGHWEMDCVVGTQGGNPATLLVLTERKTRQEIIRKMPDKTQASVLITINELEIKYRERFYEIFKTITVDNGSEFLDYKGLEISIRKPGIRRTTIYYAHPYSSWERGTNENTNKLIRRFIPKGGDIGKLSPTTIRKIENWINNYPRRIHGYKTANELVA